MYTQNTPTTAYTTIDRFITLNTHTHTHTHTHTQCFEGLKAYYGVDGKVRLFRPMENMKRLSNSAVAASLPVSSLKQPPRHLEYLTMP